MSAEIELRLIREQLAKAQASNVSAPLSSGGGGGTYDGMEGRIASLEANVSHLKDDVGELRKDVREIRGDLRNDFRWLFGLGVGAFAALVALIAHGFHWY